MDALTSDTFFAGAVRLKQQRKGYRFSIDAVLLAAHAQLRKGEKVLDLGSGCGIIPLLLAFRHPDITVYGVEIQPELAEIARNNIRENKMEDRVHIFQADMKKPDLQKISGPADLVISNPPYRKISSGRLNPRSQQAIARHEIMAGLADVTGAARRILQISGRFLIIYPAERMAELLSQMQAADLEPKWLRPVYSRRHSEAKLLIAEGIRGGKPGMKIRSPLLIYEKDGSYTPEVKQIFAP